MMMIVSMEQPPGWPGHVGMSRNGTPATKNRGVCRLVIYRRLNVSL
jgi:hypothetical protein